MSESEIEYTFYIPVTAHYQTSKASNFEVFSVDTLVLISSQTLDGNPVFLPLTSQIVKFYYTIYYEIDRSGY